MADKVDTSNIPDAGPNMSSYRAKRINSLHKSVNDTVQEQNKKRLQVSSEISALTREQQRLIHEIDMERGDFTNETAAAYNSVVKNLGLTVKNLSTGVKDITMDTAKATSSAINQYGKAIGEDISINKQNTMAMALSRATPLFGYFAAKFMETDVFKDTADKIKSSVGGAAKGVGRSLVDVFKRKEAEKIEEETPHMQTGGFVKKGGVVEVHAAEVVTPVDKLLKQIDQTKSEDIAKRLGITLETLSQSLIRMETLVGEVEQDRKTILHTFLDEYKKSKSGGREKSWQDRMLKAILELKVAMTGTANRLRIAWQKTLLQHPMFRSMLMIGQTMKSVFEAPIKFLFGLRGGFAGDVKGATATSNVYMKQVNLLALIYTKGMTFLQNIAKYTKTLAEAFIGEEIKPSSTKSYTMFGKIKGFMTSRSIGKADHLESLSERLGLDKEALREAGITKISDLLNPFRIFKNAGFTKSNIIGKMTESNFAAQKTKDIHEDVKKLVMMKKAQEKREGPHSPSMAQNIASTAKSAKKSHDIAYEREKERAIENKAKREEKKRRKKENKGNKESLLEKWKNLIASSRQQNGILAKMSDGFSKFRRGFKDMFPLVYSVLSKIFGGILKVGKTLLTLANPLITMTRFIGGKSIRAAGGIISRGANIMGGAIGGARGALAGGGLRGLAGWGMRGGLGLMGSAAALSGGLLVGGGMSLIDMVRGIMMDPGGPEGFVGGILARGLGGFLGGTKTGAAGMKHGAIKGAALGAAIGTVVPGFGTLLGAGIGGLAGGILGFVGGGKISEAIHNTLSGIKDVITVVWKVVKFPFHVLKEAYQIVGVLIKFALKKLWTTIDNWLSGPGFIGAIWGSIKDFVSGLVGKISGFFGGVIDSIKNLFKGKNIAEMLKNAIVNVLFPIPMIIKGYKLIFQSLDKWISGLPVVGTAYKKAKSAIKFASGDMSGSLQRALEGETSGVKESTNVDVAITKEMAKSYAKEETSKQKMIADEVRKTSDNFSKEMKKSTDATTTATLKSAHTIVSSNQQNIVNNNTMASSHGRMYQSNNSRIAERVATSNIN